ncbi:MAG TPA: alpha/beta hydrolase fold domain-containing protein [Isosphaeraceae bacterium]|nr:alpha/beta hydrolase fold domain-containing protein [Isosphaeraceae bacterium]
MRNQHSCLLTTILIAVGSPLALAQTEPEPIPVIPAVAMASPSAAPSGGAYPHAGIRAQLVGSGARSYWLFEPDAPRPVGRCPVAVFNHGWLAVNPGVYGAWIEHLVKQGQVVIYPRYQTDWTTNPADFLPNATAAVLDALDVLETAPERVRPDRNRFALIGHSAGGNLAVLMAASADSTGLPHPRAVLAFMPGEVLHLEHPNPADLPPETLLVVVAGDRDRVVGDSRARQIFAQAETLGPDRKEYVLYQTRRRGLSTLLADHLAPTAALHSLDSGEGPFRAYQMKKANVDHLDRQGFWSLTDATLSAGFSGRSLNDDGVLAALDQVGDGRVISGDDLSAIPRVFPSNGARLITFPAPEFKGLSAFSLPDTN